jgi:glycosyltransferase involved in cell wall biosynthesis
MDISFWLTTPVDLSNGLNRPMGGAEVSAVQLAEALNTTGHTVTLYGNTKKRYTVNEHFFVSPYFEAHDSMHQYFITVRAHPILIRRTRQWLVHDPDHLLNWSGDAFDQPNNQIFWDMFVCRTLDHFVTKSQWQADAIMNEFPFLNGKVSPIFNGVKAEYFQDLPADKDENLFIYASTFYRGVDHFLTLWPKIKEQLPDAKLHIYCKTSLYLDNNPGDVQAAPLFNALAKLPDVELKEPVLQSELIKELARAKLLLYPNDHFWESSCGVAQQSIIAGTPVVTTSRGGLLETVKTEGFCLDGDPSSDKYQDEFITKVVELCQNQDQYEKLSLQGRQRLNQESWEQTANRWISFLESL